MLIKLFSNQCERCMVVVGMLDAQGVVYEYHDINEVERFKALEEAYNKRKLVMRPSQPMPVLVQGVMLWEGEDCVIALEEGELE